MPAFIVRKILTGQATKGGAMGQLSCMVHTADKAQARVQGAAQLGVNPSAVTVDEWQEDTSHMAVQTKPGHDFDPDDVEIVQPSLRGDESFEEMV